MYKIKRRFVFIVSNVFVVAFVSFLTVFVIPTVKENMPYSSLFTWCMACLLIIAVLIVVHRVRFHIVNFVRESSFHKGDSVLLFNFLEKLRDCYSFEDFYQLLSDNLEVEGGCSILYVDRESNYVLYNSPNRLTCSKTTMASLDNNFTASWQDGYYFLDSKYGIVADYKKSRGFFLVNKKKHLYVFCPYTKEFDTAVYALLFEEFCNFQKRIETISNLSEIASLSQEWQQLAVTQRSFLPPVMPQIDNLEVAAYFRPLINVSGDYYSVLPISKTKTLLMLGDVSGKGLAAALVMGLVINTIKILEDKDDLPSMIRAVDKAIKGMKLQDKYTVLFLGIVDTTKMTIRYVNASMSDPIIITRSASGYRIKPLTSNCSVVGIIDLPDITMAEQQLFRGDVILMASDGVSEVMDDNGVELGNTQLYEDTLKTSAAKSPKEFIDDIENLVLTYNGNKKLHDDVTMLVAKLV